MNNNIDFWGGKKVTTKRRTPTAKPFLFKPQPMKRSIPKRNMTWSQAKRKYPKLSPLGDADRDGVKNKFDCRPFDRKKQGWAHKGHTFNREETTHVKMMKPEKFLRTTAIEGIRKYGEATQKPMKHHLSKEDVEEYHKGILNKDNIEKYKKVIRSRQGKMEVPYLRYDKQGRPIGHEGRHRAKAAQELGVKLMPVTIGRELKESRDWKNTREYLGDKEDWRLELENEEQITSSESADIPIKEQREYGEEKPEVLEDYDAQQLIDEEDKT